jgi:hypothetical protein
LTNQFFKRVGPNFKRLKNPLQNTTFLIRDKIVRRRHLHQQVANHEPFVCRNRFGNFSDSF